VCERGDVRASVSGSHRWELLADLSETIADNAFDEGPVWPLCPTHKNHSLNAKARGNSVKWVCTTDGVADHWTLGSLPKEGVV